MVTPDNSPDGNNAKIVLPEGDSTSPLTLASPLDRFAAAVIDYVIILLPIIYVVVAPFQRVIKVAAVFDEEWHLALFIWLASIAVLGVIVLYQTLCIWQWRCTIGMRLIGLNVRSIWPSEKVTFTQALCRALYWCISWIFFGIPFLATYSNLMRRAVHDRLTDSVVVSVRKDRHVPSPSPNEMAVVRGVFWACGIFLVLIAGLQVIGALTDLEKKTELISTLEEDQVLCAAVSDAQGEFPEVERLSVALSLFAAGSIELKCLEAEIQNLHSAKEETALYYLARSFVSSDHKDLSDMYLTQVCKLSPKSDECHLSRVIEAVSNDDVATADEEFQKLSPTPPLYVSMWALQQYIQRNDFTQAGKYLEKIPALRSVSEYLALAKTKVLWGMHKYDEARGAEATAYAFLNDEAKYDLAGFMCYESIWSDCDLVQNQSCSEFRKLTQTNQELLAGIQPSLTFLRSWECLKQDSKNYDALLNLPLNSEVKDLAIALSQNGTEGFTDQLDRGDNDERFTNEVSRRMADRTANKELLISLKDEWAAGRQTLSWEKLGETLFRKFFVMKEYSHCLIIADRLLQNNRSPKAILENAILASVRTGQMDRARKIFNQYALTQPMSFLSESRAPASSVELQEVLKLLMEKGP